MVKWLYGYMVIWLLVIWLLVIWLLVIWLLVIWLLVIWLLVIWLLVNVINPQSAIRNPDKSEIENPKSEILYPSPHPVVCQCRYLPIKQNFIFQVIPQLVPDLHIVPDIRQ
jgi:hypothetical protein